MRTLAGLFVIFAVSFIAWLIDRFDLFGGELPSAERRAEIDAMILRD